MAEASTANIGRTHLQMRLLGRTGIKISEIGFGASSLGEIADRESGLKALQCAFELGVNFVDTADVCGDGDSERWVGIANKTSPRRIHIGTKVGNVDLTRKTRIKDFSAEHVKAACDRSLERLGVTIIDLYQLDCPPPEVIAGEEIWDTLRDLKDKNKIAYYGITVGKPEDGILAIEKGDVDTVQVIYNLLERTAAHELFALAEKKRVGIIARVPLASGLLSGKYKPGGRFAGADRRNDIYPPAKFDAALSRVEQCRFLSAETGRTLAQAALRFCLAHPAVSVVIPGIKTAEQAVENIAAAGVAPLSPEELAKIDQL